MFFIVSLLDCETKKHWEIFLNNSNLTSASSSVQDPETQSLARLNSEPPSFKSLSDFIESQISMLESIEEGNVNSDLAASLSNQDKFKKLNVNTQPAKVFHNQIQQIDKNQIKKNECILNKGNHLLFHCSNFKSKSVENRIEFIKSQKRCFNCLGTHFLDKCTSKRRCNKKHHTSLHLLRNSDKTKASTVYNSNVDLKNEEVAQESSNLVINNVSTNACDLSCQVLLSTAVVKLVNDEGVEYFARALIDQGSQASFISESLFKRMHVNYKSINLPISGVGGKNTFTCKKLVSFVLSSHFYSDFSIDVEAYVIPKITSYNPTASEGTEKLDHIVGLLLADPGFCKRGQIEVLLGASIHASIIEGKVRRGASTDPIAMSTELGWIISGNSGIGSACRC